MKGAKVFIQKFGLVCAISLAVVSGGLVVASVADLIARTRTMQRNEGTLSCIHEYVALHIYGGN
jgi:hypothetical protein